MLAVAGPIHAARAQLVVRSWLPWRTVETEHFAFHYPAELEEWTLALATRVESIDSAVGRQIGYRPTRRVHVVVDDPYTVSNGSAWPFLNRPLVNLWATPPDPRNDIGEYRDWGAMLASHELAHIAHLSRPTRNTLMRRLWEALPVNLGPVAIRAPRWAIEGYATFIEGRVTGSGRPHGAWRPATLRQWALEGQLPRYDQLNTWSAYAGGEFAYLAGSAFLEWLADQRGDSSLVHVWRRLSAKQNRSFDEAFAGVFGQSPRALYGRFTTELTGKALDAARAIRAGAAGDTGEIVQRLSWSTGDPAISPDGKRVALVRRSETLPSRVIVWSTAAEPDTAKPRRDSTLLKRDPEDVAARPIFPPSKKEIAMLRSSGGPPYEGPRFLANGTVLLWRYAPRGDGSATPDLYLWNPRRGSVKRVTHGASLLDGDPLPDGRMAVATRCRGGWCDVVSVSLITGIVTTILAGNPSTSYYRPRVSPDGRRLAVARHTADGWQIVAVDLATGETKNVPESRRANRYDASWLNASTLVAVSDEGGVANIERVDIATGTSRSITRVTGAAVAPEPNRADGSVWFLSLYSQGYDVRRVVASATPSPIAALDERLAPAMPVVPGAVMRLPENRVSAPRAFGLGARLFRWIPQPELDADGAGAALGLVSNDVIGRSQVVANLAYGDGAAWRGGAVAFLWNGSRPGVRLALFDAAQRLSASRARLALPGVFDSRIAGIELALDGTQSFDTWSARYRIGASASRLRLDEERLTGAPRTVTRRSLAFADAGLGWSQRGDIFSFTESVSGNVALGQTTGNDFRRAIGSVHVSASGRGLPGLTATASYGRVTESAPLFEQFSVGGLASPLIDRALLGQRLVMPVLPSGISVGSSAFLYRAAVVLQPISWYVYGARTTRVEREFSAWNRVIGLEWAQSVPAIALAGTPAARVQLGVGQSLDPPFRRRVRGYVNLVLSP